MGLNRSKPVSNKTTTSQLKNKETNNYATKVLALLGVEVNFDKGVKIKTPIGGFSITKDEGVVSVSLYAKLGPILSLGGHIKFDNSGKVVAGVNVEAQMGVVVGKANINVDRDLNFGGGFGAEVNAYGIYFSGNINVNKCWQVSGDANFMADLGSLGSVSANINRNASRQWSGGVSAKINFGKLGSISRNLTVGEDGKKSVSYEVASRNFNVGNLGSVNANINIDTDGKLSGGVSKNIGGTSSEESKSNTGSPAGMSSAGTPNLAKGKHVLDSTTCTNHEGSKSNGCARGADFLSMNTRRNVSQSAQVQAALLLKTGRESESKSESKSGTDICPACSKAGCWVYHKALLNV